MDDLISRQAAIDEIRTMQTYKLFAGDDLLLVDQAEAMTNLMMMPAAEPSATLMKVEVGVDKESLRKAMQDAELTLLPAEKRGKWVEFANEDGELDLKCSVCGEEQGFYFGYFNFCPNCGARMEE